MTKNSTVQATTTTFSPMLMPALVFCADPLAPSATMARTRAGMVQVRKTRDVPQQTKVMMEKTRALTAIPE